jgi:hypothetical protein
MFAPQTLGFTFPQALRYHIILAHKNVLGIKIPHVASLPVLKRLGFPYPARSL